MKRAIPHKIVVGLLAVVSGLLPLAAARAQSPPIVFVVVIENKNWIGSGGIANNPAAPYINKTLRPMAAVANNYFNPSGNHPSLPNYLWIEAGRNFGIHDDGPPSQHSLATHAHLTELLHNAGIPWRGYAESITAGVCPLNAEGPYDSNGSRLYQVKHFPFVYFTDTTNGGSSRSSYCIAHARPLSQLGSDLQHGTIGRYNFITPNICHDGHDSCGGNEIAHIDGWLKAFLPTIFNSSQYRAGHVVLFVTTDEAVNGDGPIMFMALGSGVKKGYQNEIRYTHSSLLRTLQEIYGVRPFLGGAAYSNDLRDLFRRIP
jgi:hypothetical protein